MTQRPTDLELRELCDREQLRELVFAYCRAIDRRDFAALDALYHPDATDHHGRLFQGPARAFVERLPEIMASMEIVSHNVTNASFALDGDRAEGEIYFFAFHRLVDDGSARDMILGGRYADRYRRVAGTWKIEHRAVIADWIQVHDPSLCDLSMPELEGSLLGRPGPGDPAAELLERLGRRSADARGT